MKFFEFISFNIQRIGRIILIASMVYFGINVYSSRDIFQTSYDQKNYEARYLKSQWRVPNSKQPISDAELYTYSGYQYIRGGNPILTNPEQPPLGKYIIGLSILLFSNGNIASLIFATLSLVMIYKLVFLTTSSAPVSSLAVFLSSTHSIFTDQVANPAQLDIFQLFFFLLTAYYYFAFRKSNKAKHLFLCGVSLGGLLSIKVFFHSFFLTMLLFACLSLWQHDRKRRIVEVVMIFAVGGAVFVSTYIAYFFYGGTLYGFLGVQKWILEFYRSSAIDTTKLIGSFIPLILINKWRVWSEGYPYVSYERWSLLWPIYFGSGLYSLLYFLQKKIVGRTEIKFFMVWIIIYSIDLAFVPVFPRYLLLLFVPMIIVFSIFIHEKYKV